MTHPSIHVDVDGGIGRITIDRPERKNACTPAMFDALHAAAMTMRTAAPRVVVVTGTGGDFCSGADMSGDAADRMEGVGHPLQSMRRIGDAVVALHALPMPTVASVDGVAVGAGFGLALSCDLLVCSDRARFSLIFARRGLSLDFGTSYLLPRRIGVHHAKRMAFTGEIVDAGRAADLGFVNEVVTADALEGTVEELTATIAAGPPLALSMSKRMLDNADRSSFAHAVETESLAQNVNFPTRDVAEGATAFLERREPRFDGR